MSPERDEYSNAVSEELFILLSHTMMLASVFWFDYCIIPVTPIKDWLKQRDHRKVTIFNRELLPRIITQILGILQR